MKKIIILSFFLLLLTGCSATYNVEIYNDKVKEDMSFVETDLSKWDSEVMYGLTYRDLLKASLEYPYPAFFGTIVDEDDTIKLDGIEYYKNKEINDESNLGQKLEYKKFTLEDYKDSNIIKNCYKYFNVLDEGDKIVISTSLENLCFDNYPQLDNITINLKTNHKVISNNATSVNGYHYKWEISREEKDDSPIMITLYKDKYVFNYENEFVKKILTYLLIIGIIVVIGGGTYLIIKKKNNKLNKL